jgi:hypothetical protein
MPPELPARAEVEAWLRARGARAEPHRKPSRLRRWFGGRAEPRYELGPLIAIDTGLCRDHVVFKAHGEDGLLLYPASPRGSFGVFAYDGERLLALAPDNDSLEQLLRAEARPLHAAAPAAFAQFVCDLRLSAGYVRHVVLSSAEQLAAPTADSLLARQRLDREELERVRASIAAPRIEAVPGDGWTLEFASVSGGRAGLFQLANQQLRFASNYALTVDAPTVLSSRIFATISPVLSRWR